MADQKMKRGEATKELGSAGYKVNTGFQYEEFLPQLRGQRAVKKYREMIDNDAVIGAILLAMEMMLRAVDWRVEPVDDSPQAVDAQEFVETVLEDMSHTWEEFIAEAVSFLPYGFSFFEVVYKTRNGPDQKDPAKRSKYTDGRVGIRKLAPRPQWTLERFDMDENGGVNAFIQDGNGANIRIPIEKGLLFKTEAGGGSPYGRSILRNAYKSYYYLTNIQNIEAIAVERELNGLPVGRLPSEYLASDASADQLATRNKLETILRDVKLNEQGYILLPSDPYLDVEGKPTSMRMVDIELMASNGTRNIDTAPVISRYQADIARSVLADFLTLGNNERGSFALSKSKADLFLRSLEGYLRNIASVINRHLLTKLWEINGLDKNTMPQVVPGDVAPANLEELGAYVRDLMSVGAISPDDELADVLRQSANLPDQPEDADMLGRPAEEE